MFGDSYTANLILKSDDPLEAKQLSHRINGVDYIKWCLDRYDVCFDGVKEKFVQNPPLMLMLKATKLVTCGSLIGQIMGNRYRATGLRCIKK